MVKEKTMNKVGKVVIFDLDGTLALIDQRRILAGVNGKKINWKVFFDPKNIDLDQPNVDVINTFHVFQQAGFNMVIFSGRGSQTKDATIKWLDKFGIKPDVLKMRPIDSYTPDDILKKDWLDDLSIDGVKINKDDIHCVFDDRDKVVKMWRDIGLSCFQVAPGPF
jgi:hypothetical protein